MAFNGELHGIAKAYGNCHANSGVELVVRAGTIHALVGENGAGKSTAMKILFGLVPPDQGSIKYGATDVTDGWNPQKAFKHGIGMVHQHFMLAEPETVLDNLVLGAETTKFGVRRRAQERAALEELMKVTGLKLPLDKPVGRLPIGLQSRCEILKVLYRKARFLILDEPTAVLTPQETEDLLNTLRILRGHGNTILIVTHKLKEVMAVADEATVLRQGRTIGTRKIAESSVEDLSELMVGRRLQMPRAGRSETETETQPVRLSLETPKYKLELRAGEVTGIAGVEGNGQEELIHALCDPKHATGTGLALLGQDASRYSPGDVRRLPVAIIPADRHKEGLILNFNLTENLRLGREQAARRGYEYFGGPSQEERSLLKCYDVRPDDPALEARALSGGNQQKVVVARELGGLPAESVVIAVHPTRGVDLGAIEFIHGQLLAAAKNGAAVLLVSSELDELMSLSHRIGVLYRGAIAQWFEPGASQTYDEKAIGLAMLSGATAKGATGGASGASLL